MDRKQAPDPVYILRGSSSAVSVVKFAPSCVSSEGLLASGSSSGQISLWNLKTRRVQSTLDCHGNKAILGLDVTCKSNLISQGRDGVINIWDISTSSPEVVCKLPAPVLGFCKFSVLSNDHFDWLAAAEQSEIMIRDLKSHDVILKMKPEGCQSYGMCMCVELFSDPCTNQPMLLAGYENGCIALWDVSTGKVLSQVNLHTESVMCMDVDRGQQKVITGSADNKLYVTAFDSQNNLSSVDEVELKTAGTAVVRLRSDSKILATGSWDGRIRVYSWKSMKPLAVLNYHSATVNSIDFSDLLPARGMWMAAGSKDCRISLWDLYNEAK